jgi:Protein of unknown function (DUF3551)
MLVRSAILIGHLLVISPLHAQGNPYCAQYSDGASLDCSFSNLSMCEQSVTGVGGVCILNPRAAEPSSVSVTPLSSNSSYVPPPPMQQQSSGPLQFPDAPRPCNPVIDGTYCASAGSDSTQSGIAPIQSLSSDLSIGADPPATLGAITFNSDGSDCIGLFRRMSCGGP